MIKELGSEAIDHNVLFRGSNVSESRSPRLLMLDLKGKTPSFSFFLHFFSSM